MARIRTLKPEFFTNSTTGRLTPPTAKLFLGLHNHCDDYGVIRFDPIEYKARILPYERSDQSVSKALAELEQTDPPLILHFVCCDRRYLWLPFFAEHQVINRPSKPLLDGWVKETTPETYPSSEWLNQAESSDTQGALSEGSLHTHPRARGRAPLPSFPIPSSTTGSNASTSRERNEQWDGLAAVFGYSPAGAEAKEWGKHCAALKEFGDATVASIVEAGRRYQAHMPDITMTPRALVSHYQRLMAGPPEPTANGKRGGGYSASELADMAMKGTT